MRYQEAVAAWAAHAAMHAQNGAILPEVVSYIPDEYRHNFALAMDEQPGLVTASNAGIPAYLTTLIDPEVFKVLFSPNQAATIFGERRKGTWLDETAMFPVVEHTGEVSSYGDFNENGRTGANTSWPQRQSYLWQTVIEYGERELERAGLGRINWISELDTAGATVMNKYSNLTYFYGVQGLQNYGLLNDPNLSAPITPAVKAAGGVGWIKNGSIVATANEIYADIEALLLQLVEQTGGLVNAKDSLVLAMSPGSAVALTATNSFGVNVTDLLKKNIPNLRVEDAVQYGVKSPTNPQGSVGGNFVQLFSENVEGQETGYCSFNEKMRSHPIIRAMSSYKKKVTGGSWGAIIRQPMAISGMIGV